MLGKYPHSNATAQQDWGKAFLGDAICQYIWEQSHTGGYCNSAIRYVGKLTSPHSKGDWIKLLDWTAWWEKQKTRMESDPDRFTRACTSLLRRENVDHSKEPVGLVLVALSGRPWSKNSQAGVNGKPGHSDLTVQKMVRDKLHPKFEMAWKNTTASKKSRAAQAAAAQAAAAQTAQAANAQ